MISFLKDYTLQILFLSVILSIVQLLLPSGKFKKDVSFTMMMIITIVLVQPIFRFLNQDINFNALLKQYHEEMEIEVSKRYFEQNYDAMLKETFENNLKEDIVDRLKRAGYQVHSVECVLDEDTYEPQSLELQIETEDGFVQPVTIEVMKQNSSSHPISLEDQSIIQKVLMESYGVSRNNITINGG